MCWVDKYIWNSKERSTKLSVFLHTMIFFRCWSNEVSIVPCALTRLELVIAIAFGGWWLREWWKPWTWRVFLAPQSVCVWVFVFRLSVVILVSWESTFDTKSSKGILVYIKVQSLLVMVIWGTRFYFVKLLNKSMWCLVCVC
jgi:hypothetical protein